MATIPQPRCADLQLAGFDAQRAAEETWEAMLQADFFVEGEYVFRSNMRATLKGKIEQLYAKPKQLAVILGHFATFPCVQDADVLLFVPDGMTKFMTILGQELDKPVANAQRRPGSSARDDFVFVTDEDRELALTAEAPVIGEDVVTKLGSVAGMRRLLRPDQSVHALAMLLRDVIDPTYQEGLVDHYLVRKRIPTDKDEFNRLLAAGQL